MKTLHKTLGALLAALPLLAPVAARAAAAPPIQIAHVYGKSGPLAVYGDQIQRGLELGLDYATQGTGEVLGRKLVLRVFDDQGKAGRARALVQQEMADPQVALVTGPVNSGNDLAVLPLAAQYHKIILPEGVADSITGKDFNPYVFRIGRNSSQDAIAQALALGGKGVCASVLAPDYAFGHDGAAAFKTALQGVGGRVISEEFLPGNTTDFTAGGERLINALKGASGCSSKDIFVIWAGAANPFGGLQALNPQAAGIHITSGGNILQALALYKPVVGMQGAAYYYFKLPHNPVNDWLVAEHFKRYKSPPDFFTCEGFAEAQAIVAALRKAGSTSTPALMKALAGLRFESPKGEITIRPQDHQAMQDMYHFEVVLDPAATFSGGVALKLVNVIHASQMHVPIENR
ncbi:substrate-binding domain-containing protein [Thiomonas sp.]|jgi:branched-chain amino acid transport system substrate-binding protein|uniref:substrate-binding domain-containing protein n=1 Tax=Thiomonas sp. TaxID=2047785 RepID=UPI00261CCBFB|nr:substrate-binding domain-containing protein [Thiomonas sp.]